MEVDSPQSQLLNRLSASRGLRVGWNSKWKRALGKTDGCGFVRTVDTRLDHHCSLQSTSLNIFVSQRELAWLAPQIQILYSTSNYPGSTRGYRSSLFHQAFERERERERERVSMGLSVSRMFSLLWSKKEIRILILGLVCWP